MGLAVWLRSGLHAGKPHGGLRLLSGRDRPNDPALPTCSVRRNVRWTGSRRRPREKWGLTLHHRLAAVATVERYAVTALQPSSISVPSMFINGFPFDALIFILDPSPGFSQKTGGAPSSLALPLDACFVEIEDDFH
jgi:hypothetical protein